MKQTWQKAVALSIILLGLAGCSSTTEQEQSASNTIPGSLHYHPAVEFTTPKGAWCIQTDAALRCQFPEGEK